MTNTVEKPSVVTEDHLTFLDAIRDSGVTNMFGAGTYLVDEFGVSRNDSHTILSYWMKTFSQRHPKE